jgi:hypothetical protein
MTEISMTKTHTEDSEFLVLNFEHSNFDIVSDFDIRILRWPIKLNT